MISYLSLLLLFVAQLSLLRCSLITAINIADSLADSLAHLVSGTPRHVMIIH